METTAKVSKPADRFSQGLRSWFAQTPQLMSPRGDNLSPPPNFGETVIWARSSGSDLLPFNGSVLPNLRSCLCCVVGSRHVMPGAHSRNTENPPSEMLLCFFLVSCQHKADVAGPTIEEP